MNGITGNIGLGSPMDCTVREPEVASALARLQYEIGEVEISAGDLLRRLEAVSSKSESKGYCEPTLAYTAPLAVMLRDQTDRITSLKARIRDQLDRLELP